MINKYFYCEGQLINKVNLQEHSPPWIDTWKQDLAAIPAASLLGLVSISFVTSGYWHFVYSNPQSDWALGRSNTSCFWTLWCSFRGILKLIVLMESKPLTWFLLSCSLRHLILYNYLVFGSICFDLNSDRVFCYTAADFVVFSKYHNYSYSVNADLIWVKIIVLFGTF